jgi:hypothetical protein
VRGFPRVAATELALRFAWLGGAWSDSQRVAGNRHHIPKANWLHAHGVLRRLRGALVSNLIPVSVWFDFAAMKESHEAVLDSLGCRIDIDPGRRLQ